MAIYSLILQLQTRGTISVTWKKTALPVLVCLGLLTLFCSCNSYPDDSLYQAILETDNNASPLVEHYYPAGIPRTVSEMPETAAVIVRGTFLDDAQGEITYLDEVLDLGRGAAPGERSVLSAQTTSTFEITKVIQGDLQVGDQIKISEPYYVDNQDGVETITIRVAEGDIGKVIGKQGKIAMSIRTLAKAVGIREGKKYSIEIED